jgi:hypothetical protein
MDLGESLIKIEVQILSSFHKVTEGKHPTFRFKICNSLTENRNAITTQYLRKEWATVAPIYLVTASASGKCRYASIYMYIRDVVSAVKPLIYSCVG